MEPATTEPVATGLAWRLFTNALWHVLVAWLVGFALVIAMVIGTDPNFLWGAIFVSIASGAVSVVALGPVAWLARSSREAFFADESCSPSDQQAASVPGSVPGSVTPTGANWAPLASALMSGVMLRLVGTVALFLLCRYQMGQQSSVIAAWVAGWYLWLASIEVYSLAKAVPAPLTK